MALKESQDPISLRGQNAYPKHIQPHKPLSMSALKAESKKKQDRKKSPAVVNVSSERPVQLIVANTESE